MKILIFLAKKFELAVISLVSFELQFDGASAPETIQDISSSFWLISNFWNVKLFFHDVKATIS